MDKEGLMEKLQEIFRDVFDDDSITISESTNANDIGAWDSLTNISILAAVQDEFAVTFEIDEIVAIKSAGDMLNAILRKI